MLRGRAGHWGGQQKGKTRHESFPTSLSLPHIITVGTAKAQRKQNSKSATNRIPTAPTPSSAYNPPPLFIRAVDCLSHTRVAQEISPNRSGAPVLTLFCVGARARYQGPDGEWQERGLHTNKNSQKRAEESRFPPPRHNPAACRDWKERPPTHVRSHEHNNREVDRRRERRACLSSRHYTDCYMHALCLWDDSETRQRRYMFSDPDTKKGNNEENKPRRNDTK